MRIELNDVTVDTRHGPILTGVTLSLEPASKTVITGPGSCGKSVLHSVLLWQSRPTSGSMIINTVPAATMSAGSLRRYRTQLGVIAQIPTFDHELTVFENLLLAAAARGLRREEATAAALEALADVGMSHRRSHRVDELSDAERTLVGIARAVTGPTSMLLIDDAFVGLDEPTLRTALDMMLTTASRREIGLVITTSDPTLAELIPGCDRYTMHEGRLSPLQEAA